MEIADDFMRRCRELYEDHDIPLIASVLGHRPIDVCRALRRARVVLGIQSYDLAYIVENKNLTPQAITEYLGLTYLQFSRARNKLGLSKEISSNTLTLETCEARTRWLIEDRLKLDVNDKLPRRITGQHFSKNGLSSAIEFATRAKAKMLLEKNFSACAFLVCRAYPGRFKHWQFLQSRSEEYFSGKYGRKHYLDALLWLIEEKMAISRATLPHVIENVSFLTRYTLDDYGLGSEWWRRLWPTKPEMLEALARHAGFEPHGQADLTTVTARARLEAEGIDITRCAIPGCAVVGTTEIQVHHIVRRATQLTRGFKVHAAPNLIPLCRNYHGIADRFRPKDFDLSEPATLRAQLLAKLSCETDVLPSSEAETGHMRVSSSKSSGRRRVRHGPAEQASMPL